MQLTIRNITLSLSLCAAFAACSERVVLIDEQTGSKTPIELSVGGVDGAMQNVTTKATAVITDEVSTLTFSNFDVASKLFMVMKSEWVSLPSGYEDINFGGTHDTKYCVTCGEVAANQDKVVFNTGLERYWDDAHARSSKLSIWAFTAPGATYDNCTFGASDGIQGWKTTSITPVINTWSVYKSGTEQIASDLISQNLCFSNNIVDYTSESKTDRRLGFKTPEKKFDGGKLVFYHAMSKITIHIKKGNGYQPSDPFTFKSNTTIALTNYNVSGTFDIADGKFSSTTAGNISKISTTTTATGDAYTLQALVIPGTTHSTNNGSIWNKDNPSTSMSFTINDNLYLISQDDLITALRNNSANNGIAAGATTVEMEAGKHYIFTFTIGKKQIDNLTAQVVNWEEVAAEEFAPSNARIKLNLEERDNALIPTDRFSFYRAAKDNTGAINDDYTTYDWKTGYNNTGITPTYESSPTAHWTTNWFWESNLNFFHFRALAKDNGSAKVVAPNNVVTDASNGDYYVLSHNETAYDDILWGAPMTDVDGGNEVSDAATLKWNYGPDTNGFDGLDTKAANDHQIYKAIGPTKNQIKLILFHMMSDVTFQVKTSGSTDPDRVNLGTGSGTDVTKIELQSIHKEGHLIMGNGLVKGSDAVGNYLFTTTPAPDGSGIVKWEHYGAIPQNLENVVLVITTPDNNQYKVAMKDVLAASSNAISNNNIANPYKTVTSGDNAGKYIIIRWYPGFKYTYTFTLKKKGIVDVQATIVDWENVTAGDDNVQIQ